MQQNENHGVTQQTGPDITLCLHKSGNDGNENRNPPGAVQSPDIAPECAPIVCVNCCKPANAVTQTTPSAAKHNRTIRAKDYKPLEIPEPQTACYACGKCGAWYVEKFTTERRARPKDQQDARRVCRSCYKAQVKAEQQASVPLPGTFDMARCERVTAGVGKCSVCGLVKAAWIDREAGVKLCEHCYGRGVRENAREAGVV